MAIIRTGGKTKKDVKKKKEEKKPAAAPKRTGQLSQAEKLASLNPAQRREAQRTFGTIGQEAAGQLQAQARDIAGRGFQGTVEPGRVPTTPLMPEQEGRQTGQVQEEGQPPFLQRMGITSPESTLPFGITPKTSVRIGLAGLTALGTASFLSAYGARTVATAGLSSPLVTKVATGGDFRRTVFEKAGEYARFPANTKTARTTISYIAKLVAGSRFAQILIGFAAGSIPFLATQSFNDRTDSTFTWTQAAEEALERGDIEAAKEYRDLLAEVNEMNQNLISVDTLNYPQSTVIKVKSGLDLIDEKIKNAELEAEKAEEPPETEAGFPAEKFSRLQTRKAKAEELRGE